ncbi:MAG: type II toxin-antitoxin system VapC family toxin [Candidatus Desantisbacteria bacterium]
MGTDESAMSTVYIESTVISYYTGRPSQDLIVAAHQQLTREWWENILPECSPFISQFVLDEISRGDHEAVNKRIKAIKGIPLLEVVEPIVNLGLEYFDAIGIPEKVRTDAFHIAIAVYHGLDYLVTWNCTHITGGRVRGIVEKINDKHGFVTPIICTPEELMEV